MSSTGNISFSGIGSGTDFNEIVAQLVEVESYGLYKLEDQRDVAMETYEAMTDLINTITEAKDALGQLNEPAKFLLKLASSSNENLVSATADHEAVDGNFTVHVDQMASNAIWASRTTYASKDTNINPGGDTTLTYTYEGKSHTLNVPKNTTLEGLAHMLNEDRTNPGVKMQIITTAEGYTFQIAGTESGQHANLQIEPSSLLGFGSSGSTWESYNTVTGTNSLGSGQSPSSFSYSLTLAGSNTPINIPALSGDQTQQDLVNALNTAAGSTVASFDPLTGELVLDGVKSLTTSIDGVAQTPLDIAPTMTGHFTGDLDTPVAAGTYTFRDTDGNDIDVVLAADGDMSDLFTAMSNEGFEITAEDDGAGGTNLNFTGITEIVSTPGINLNPSAASYNYTTAANATDAIQANIIPEDFKLSILADDGTSFDVNLTNTMTYDDMVSAINAAAPAGVSAAIDPTTNKLTMSGISSMTSSSSAFTEMANFDGRVTGSDGWIIQEGQNAEFRLDNFEQVLTSSSNEVSGVIEGVTLTLKGTGTAQITIASDTDSVKANIQTALDAINSVISKVQDLTAITDDPDSAYVDDESNTNYNLSGKTQDSALTGEYSVRNFLSRLKSEMIGQPAGFNTMTSEDIYSGDLVAALSQMGIKTVTDADDPNFGLFAIAPSSAVDALQVLDQETFDNLIANDIQAVINFFAADDKGTTSSGDFGYSNHIEGITQPGTYSVEYTITDPATGAAEVYINGTLASRSSSDSNIYTVGGTGPEAGLSITLYDLDPSVAHTGTVSIQRGLVPSLEAFFTDELKFHTPDPDDPSLSQDNGSLMISQNNYKELVDNFDKQISNELTRLENYESTQLAKFARLDTLLAQYNNNMSTLENQLGQL